MKSKVKLIYNPVAGSRMFLDHMDTFFKKFKEYRVEVYRTREKENLVNELSSLKGKEEDYYAIIVAGGDGTVSKVVNALMLNNIYLPLGIIPAGTTNDFAVQLNIPDDYRECYNLFLNKEKVDKVDVGKIGNNYFINVCVGGNFSSIAHKTNYEFKNKLGRIAYYLQGIRDLPNLTPFPMRIHSSQRVIEEDIFLYLIMNSKRAGGFDNLAQNASLNDGLFDLIAVKARKIYKLPNLILKLFQNKHLKDDKIITLQDKYFKIELIKNKSNTFSEDIPVDVDGEKGPSLPVEINVIPRRLKVFHNNTGDI
ncbi:MAG: YegS/Rv2252/BmrU family lipid kinase [Halanaerobiaceae bacterium]